MCVADEVKLDARAGIDVYLRQSTRAVSNRTHSHAWRPGFLCLQFTRGVGKLVFPFPSSFAFFFFFFQYILNSAAFKNSNKKDLSTSIKNKHFKHYLQKVYISTSTIGQFKKVCISTQIIAQVYIYNRFVYINTSVTYTEIYTIYYIDI